MLLNYLRRSSATHRNWAAFSTDTVMAILQDGELDWVTKELFDPQGHPPQRLPTLLRLSMHHEGDFIGSLLLGISPEKINDIGDDRYQNSPHFTDAEKVLMDLTVQIGVDANRLSKDLWNRLHNHFSEPQIVEAVFTITQYIAISKFGDALGVALEPVFSGMDPILHVDHVAAE